MRFRTPHEWAITPFRLAALYLLVGLAGLVLSDLALPVVFEGELLRTIQSLKGAIEVGLTAVFIYALVRLSWDDLRLKERAMDEAPVGITITDPDREDNPLVFANRRFETLTGYDDEEVVGRNCRFLQGEETDPETRARLRAAIDEERPLSVDIRNYRKNGEMFWNKVTVAPVRDADGAVTNYVGFQTDITDRKIREERLEVLNRVLRHNFRNKLNVIDGNLTLLREDLDGDSEDEKPLDAIDGAVGELLALIGTVRRTEQVFGAAESTDGGVEFGTRLADIVSSFRHRYPDATITLSLPEEGASMHLEVGVCDAISEAITNAIEHNDGDRPTVDVRVRKAEPGWISVEIEDDGPGIPADELAALQEGETPLRHGTHMGLWMMDWIVRRAGGTMTVAPTDDRGTRLELSLPTQP